MIETSPDRPGPKALPADQMLDGDGVALLGYLRNELKTSI